MALTVTLLSPGAMGSAVAARLAAHGATVLTSLQGRSEASRARARAAGMEDAVRRAVEYYPNNPLTHVELARAGDAETIPEAEASERGS